MVPRTVPVAWAICRALIERECAPIFPSRAPLLTLYILICPSANLQGRGQLA